MRQPPRARVVAALLRDGNRVLLCHRSPQRRWYPDVWDLPGGHVERRELPGAALARERHSGGSWHTWSFYARSSFRNWNTPGTRYTLVGMRLLREAD